MSTKNPKRGRPPVDSELVRARMERDLVDALDAFATAENVTRPEAVRILVRDHLIGLGHIKEGE